MFGGGAAIEEGGIVDGCRLSVVRRSNGGKAVKACEAHGELAQSADDVLKLTVVLDPLLAQCGLFGREVGGHGAPGALAAPLKVRAVMSVVQAQAALPHGMRRALSEPWRM